MQKIISYIISLTLLFGICSCFDNKNDEVGKKQKTVPELVRESNRDIIVKIRELSLLENEIDYYITNFSDGLGSKSWQLKVINEYNVNLRDSLKNMVERLDSVLVSYNNRLESIERTDIITERRINYIYERLLELENQIIESDSLLNY